ncbi:MAG TPA: DUF6502 family protein [Burkholderiaceae bacterium]|nr:DUF6502 family protein [Burkholderiaceae bacterium]
MTDDTQSGATRADVLLDESVDMLTPLIRLLVSQGVTYPQFASELKRSFLRAAHAELRSAGKRVSDSAISLLSGVHRKDVRALTADGGLAIRPIDRALSVADEVFTRWVSDPTYLAADGLPRVLPLRGRGEDEPSFESLAQSVSRDFHSRAILDEMTRLGIAEAAGEFVRLRVERFVPDAGFAETLSYVSRNVSDHLGAVESNLKAIQAKARSPFLEQSVFADGLSDDSVRELQELARRIWESALRRMYALATDRLEHDQQVAGEQVVRMRFGVYFYSEPDSPLARHDDAPVADGEDLP